IWDPVTGEHTGTLMNASDDLLMVAWSPDGSRLAGGSLSGGVQIWDTATRLPVSIVKGHTKALNAVAWCPSGKRLASGSRDSTVKIWDAITGKEILTLRGHTGDVQSVSWSPDGTRLVSTGLSVVGSIKFWDPITGTEVISFKIGSPGGVAWSRDGSRWATVAGTLILDATAGYRLAGRGHQEHESRKHENTKP